MKDKFISDGDDSENLSDFGFAKNCRIPTAFGFELQHIPSLCVFRFSGLVRKMTTPPTLCRGLHYLPFLTCTHVCVYRMHQCLLSHSSKHMMFTRARTQPQVPSSTRSRCTTTRRATMMKFHLTQTTSSRTSSSLTRAGGEERAAASTACSRPTTLSCVMHKLPRLPFCLGHFLTLSPHSKLILTL